MKSAVRLVAVLVGAAGCLLADVSYQETVRYTGGSLVDLMKGMQGGLMGKMMGGRMGRALQDQTYKVYLKGNKMARVSQDTSLLFDLDAGSMTTIDHQKKAYTTVTFDEMNERMEEMRKRMNRDGAPADNLHFDAKVEETSETKTIAGQAAKLYILTVSAQDQQAGMKVKSNLWAVSTLPGLDELRAFQMKMAEKLKYGANFNPMMSSASAGMQQAAKEIAKMKGYPLSQEMTVTGVQTAGNPMMAMMGGGKNNDPNAPFLITQTESSEFAETSVNDSVFEIPAGYKQQKSGHR